MDGKAPSSGDLSGRELAIIVMLNLLPLAGVVLWGWQSYDLVLLYWIENLIIGAFTALRMLVRPYEHPIELAFPLFLTPFFILHYGGFCYGHGIFVVGMLSGADPSPTLLGALREALAAPPMLMAVLALLVLQAYDWVRDSYQHGLGAEGVAELMTAPYRRIVVLHLTILGGGFVLMTLGEPVLGLVVLVLLKIASDLWHWRRASTRDDDSEDFELTPEQLEEMQEKFAEPKVTVNGREKRFESFAALKRSREFRMMRSVLRLMGARKELKVINSYLELQIAKESQPRAATPR